MRAASRRVAAATARAATGRSAAASVEDAAAGKAAALYFDLVFAPALVTLQKSTCFCGDPFGGPGDDPDGEGAAGDAQGAVVVFDPILG